MKPKITLDNFGLADSKTTYWLENLDIGRVSDKNILQSYWNITNLVDSADDYGTGYTNLTALKAYSEFIDSSGNEYLLGFTNDYIFATRTISTSSSPGQIHKTVGSSSAGADSFFTSNYPDMVTTKEGHILYSSMNHVGIGIHGTCTSSSSTTKIVDKEGRNFTTLGVLNTDVGGSSVTSKWVYNIDKKERYEVTSISTTTSTNDTLNFSAGTACEDGDEFFVFVDNGWTGSDSFVFSTPLGRNIQFQGQISSNNWKRQILLFVDDYVILNGNYLATLNDDLVTFAPLAKQLPSFHQAECMSKNNGKLLVGCDVRGKGALLLLDASLQSFESIIKTSAPINAIADYKDGWIFISAQKIYFTDGYSISRITSLLDADPYKTQTPQSFNYVKIADDKLFIVGLQYSQNRNRAGYYIYDLKENGWSFVPNLTLNGDYEISSTPNGAIHPWTYNGTYMVYTSGNGIISRIDGNTATQADSVAMFFVQLPEKMRLSEVELNISNVNSRTADNLSNSENLIYVSTGDGRYPLFSYGQLSATSTTTSLINPLGLYMPAKNGQEILVTSATYATGGERRFITSITNGGTNTETYTIDSPLSSDITDTTDILITNLYKAGRVSQDYNTSVDMLGNLRFTIPDFYSDKLWLQVRFNNLSGNAYSMQINSINIY